MQISAFRDSRLKTRSPAVAEGPRDAGVPVEMSVSMSIVNYKAIAHNREAVSYTHLTLPTNREV